MQVMAPAHHKSEWQCSVSKSSWGSRRKFESYPMGSNIGEGLFKDVARGAWELKAIITGWEIAKDF